MIEKIKSIEFGLLSPKALKKIATVEVDRYDLYDRDNLSWTHYSGSG